MATKMKKVKEVKKEEIIDFTKPEKISAEELAALQTTIRTIDRLTADIGRIETQKYAMLVGMQTIQKEIDASRNEFMSKYGTDNVNIQTGDISYPETTVEDGEVNS
tara:strand:- start:7 stop:324 length:318 start_codon:yes stop_codon:yes gene_type:complete